MSDLDTLSAVSMPSVPFLRIDRFAAVADGGLYVGQPDTDPTQPENQVPVYILNEDGTLTQIEQPVKIGIAGYPVYNGQVVKVLTQPGTSLDVRDRNNAQMFYFDNLTKYDPEQMWKLLQSSTGWEFVGTTYGNVKQAIQGYITPWNFVGKPEYATETEAIQAMFDYAKANNLPIRAFNWEGTTAGIVTAENITIVGGIWNLVGNNAKFTNCVVFDGIWRRRSIWSKGTYFERCRFEQCRILHASDDVLILNSKFSGKVGGNVASIVMQGNQVEGDNNKDYFGRLRVENCEFNDISGGIFQQGGHFKITRMILRNLTFTNLDSDAIELNVVNDGSFTEGCTIENIEIYNSNATLANSNLGIGIGVAGAGPYSWDAPETNYAKNFVIRNVTAVGVRQCVHVEVGSDFVIENVNVNPDANKSIGTGLIVSGVYIAGSKNFTINGVSGTPVPSATVPITDIRMICLVPGPTDQSAQQYNTLCRDYTIRNVDAKGAWVQLWVDAYPGYGSIQPHSNHATIENVDCYRFSCFGVGTVTTLRNITCTTSDCLGDTSTGGGYNNQAGSGTLLYIFTKSVLNIDGFYSETPGEIYRKPRYMYTNVKNCNIQVDQGANFDGRVGAQLTPITKAYAPQITAHGGYGNFFPRGREFDVGDQVFVYDYGSNDPANGPGGIVALKAYVVTGFGAYYPANTGASTLRAAAAGAKRVYCALTPTGTSTGSPWLYTDTLTAGTRIKITTSVGQETVTITRAPFQPLNDNDNTDNPANTSLPIAIEFTPALQGSVAANARFTMAYPITTRPPISA